MANDRQNGDAMCSEILVKSEDDTFQAAQYCPGPASIATIAARQQLAAYPRSPNGRGSMRSEINVRTGR